jgi:hypothetical protein
LGRDIAAEKLISKVTARLKARGLVTAPDGAPLAHEVEPRVDPYAFNVEALSAHADSSQPLPLETHRTGLGRAVLLAKWAFRKSCQVLINETLSRQTVFNGHVRDSYAQLSAEVQRLRERLAELEPPPPAPAPLKAKTKTTAKRKPR